DLALQEERLKHEHRLKDLEAESIARQERQIEKMLRSLATSALTKAALHIKSTTPGAASLLTSSELEEEVYRTLRENIAPGKSSPRDATPILARAHDLSDRERRFWVRTSMGAVATIAIIS